MDKRLLMRHGDEVFIGEVLDAAATDYKWGRTLWRVRVVTQIKGSRSGDVLVDQLGYIDRNGRLHALAEQELLSPGKRYLLVTTREGGAPENTLLAGPAASLPVRSPVHERRLIQEYHDAMR